MRDEVMQRLWRRPRRVADAQAGAAPRAAADRLGWVEGLRSGAAADGPDDDVRQSRWSLRWSRSSSSRASGRVN
jgi:hypothetical protein